MTLLVQIVLLIVVPVIVLITLLLILLLRVLFVVLLPVRLFHGLCGRLRPALTAALLQEAHGRANLPAPLTDVGP